MPQIEIPFPFGDLPLKPEISGKVRVSDDVQQTLATLLGWDGSSRRLLRCALSGVLQVTSPQVRRIYHVGGGGAGSIVTFGNIPTSEVMIRGHPSNGDLIWVALGQTPTSANGWPLSTNDNIVLSVDNLNRLQILIVTATEQAIITYTR